MLSQNVLDLMPKNKPKIVDTIMAQ